MPANNTRARRHDGALVGHLRGNKACKLQPVVETHCEPVHPSTWIVPDNHGQPFLPEESGPFFSTSNRQRPATRDPEQILAHRERHSQCLIPGHERERQTERQTPAVDHWLA